MPPATLDMPVRTLEKYMTKAIMSPTVSAPFIVRNAANPYIRIFETTVIAFVPEFIIEAFLMPRPQPSMPTCYHYLV